MTNTTDIISKAIDFAFRKHAGQFRKSFVGVPYFSHVMDVFTRLRTWGVRDLDLLAAAILHDTLEDTDTTEEELETNFNKRVLSLVKAVTRPAEAGKDKASKIAYLENMAKTYGEDVLILKLADRYCNVIDYIAAENGKYAAKYAMQVQPLIAKFETNFASNYNSLAAQDIYYLSILPFICC